MSISPCHLSRFPLEFQLACRCCRSPLLDEDRDEIRRLLARVDVPAFLDLVITRHRIGPLVHAAMKQLPAQALPAGLMARLSESTRVNAVKALRSQRTHLLLARWLAKAGIEWLPFKGITVAQRYYGGFAARQVNDLDIWVPPSKVLQARALLEAQGFRFDAANRHWDLAARGPRHLAYLTRYYFEEQHYSGEFGPLELHWQLTGNVAQFNLAPQALLDRADPIAMAGSTLRVMNDDDLLLYLCEHGGRHGWFRLKWLADLPRVLAHRPWDWALVLERARSAGCRRTLLLGLALCRDLFGWVPPPLVARELRATRSMTWVGRTVRYALLAPDSVCEAQGHIPLVWRLADSARALLLSGTWSAVTAHLWRRSLSPKDLRVIELPDRWFGMYYVLRPFLLAVRQLRA